MSPRGRKPKDPNAPKKPRTNTKRDVGDITFDLVKIFGVNFDIGKVDDDLLEKKITDLQKMRLMRFTTSKRKSALDRILSGIDLKIAKQYLGVLDKEKEQNNV